MMSRSLQTLAAAVLSAALAGCASGMRFSPVRPGVNQVIRVTSGDRIFFEMKENASAGFRWDCTCDDPDVEVSMRRVPPKKRGVNGAPGLVRVEIRIHRGYDGPSAVTFVLKRPGSGRIAERFTPTFFKRNGDAAFWK